MSDTTDYYGAEEVKGEKRFVGLANQGATCYMNSLLQTLFMTPELRRQLYMWRYDPSKHGTSDDCIPFQLQLLFSKLQLAKVSYLETTGLTKSFQWDVREGFQQHDVQEFCRVLFDAIEISVKSTAQETIISDLFEGKLIDYVKCDACGHESQREDKYLDISLAVKNDFDHIYNDSVEKALDNFVGVEHLTGSNQYFCEACQSKQDAKKGLKFKSFPPILMLQLKRFDLDYETMQRIKINDKVSFPQVLNLNPYINLAKSLQIGTAPMAVDPPPPSQSTDPFMDVEMGLEDLEGKDMKYKSTNTLESMIADIMCTEVEMDYVAKKAHIDKMAAESRIKRLSDITRFKQEGENVYELFSILIHSGSALGGHYYSYIKSFHYDRWFCFNDSTVYEIDEKDLEKAFGGETHKVWGGYTTSACAYLLAYRKVKPENVNVIEDLEVPDYILESIDEEKHKEEQEKRVKEEKKRIFSLKVYYQGKDLTVEISKDQSLEDLLEKAIGLFRIEGVAKEDVRIRAYSSYQDTFQETYTGREKLSLDYLGVYNYKVMAIETKQPGETFEEYSFASVSLKAMPWDSSILSMQNLTLQQKTLQAKRLQLSKDSTLADLMKKIEAVCHVPVDRQKILKRPYSSTVDAVEVVSDWERSASLSALRLYEGTCFLVEDLACTGWESELEQDTHRYTIKFNHPDDIVTYWNQSDYKLSAVVDSRETVEFLKKRIGDIIGLQPEEFILKRGSKAGTEIKELTYKVNMSTLYNGAVLFVERGVPSRLDEFRICVSFADPPKATAADYAMNEFTELIELPISSNLTVSSAIELICLKVNSRYPSMELRAETVRLRERSNDKLARVMVGSDVMRNYSMYEKKMVSVQVVGEQSTVYSPSSSLLVVVRLWSPVSWELSQPIEIELGKNCTFREFGERVSGMYGIAVERLMAARIAYTWNFNRTELLNQQWYALNDTYNRLSSNPWYLPSDGTLLMYSPPSLKDSSEILRPLTDEERDRYGNKGFITSTSTFSIGYYKYEKHKEEAVKIRVKNVVEDGDAASKKRESDKHTEDMSMATDV